MSEVPLYQTDHPSRMPPSTILYACQLRVVHTAVLVVILTNHYLLIITNYYLSMISVLSLTGGEARNARGVHANLASSTLLSPPWDHWESHGRVFFFFFTLVTGPRRSLSLKLSDARVYEP